MLEQAITKTMTVKELTEALIVHLAERGYSNRSLKDYKCIFNRFNYYCETNKTNFSLRN